MTDTTEAPPPAEKTKRKWKRKPRLVVNNAPKVPDEFQGLSAIECCDACDEHKCVISGINVCAHPMKGGLQAAQLSKPDVVKRYRRARLALAGAKLDLQKLAGGG